MEPTLDLAMARLFGESDRPAAPSKTAPASSATAPAASSAAGPSWERLAQEANATYQRAIEAQKAGDWAKYGEEIARLGEILERMKAGR
jgi:uncharacterized membrane protein (UPF0182 family)